MFFFYNSRKAPSLYSTVSKLHKNDPFHLIEGSSSSKDDVGVVHLYGPLPKPHQIGSNTYGSACDLEECKISNKQPSSFSRLYIQQVLLLNRTYKLKAKQQTTYMNVCLYTSAHLNLTRFIVMISS